MTRPSDERCGRVGHFFGIEALADRPLVITNMSSTGEHITTAVDPWAPSAYCLGTDATAQDWESRDDLSWGGDER